MEDIIRQHIEKLSSKDRDVQGQSYLYLIEQTEKSVNWAYEVWDDLLKLLGHDDNRTRSIAGQLLSNLAKSDPEERMRQDFNKLIEGTKDEKFVTARHILQSLWNVGIVNKNLQQVTLSGLGKRYQNCADEKNCTLIRYDIIVVLRKMYDERNDDTIKAKALELIEQESDEKYRNKYLKEWKELLKINN